MSPDLVKKVPIVAIGASLWAERKERERDEQAEADRERVAI